jgi:hypothetical protein
LDAQGTATTAHDIHAAIRQWYSFKFKGATVLGRHDRKLDGRLKGGYGEELNED